MRNTSFGNALKTCAAVLIVVLIAMGPVVQWLTPHVSIAMKWIAWITTAVGVGAGIFLALIGAIASPKECLELTIPEFSTTDILIFAGLGLINAGFVVLTVGQGNPFVVIALILSGGVSFGKGFMLFSKSIPPKRNRLSMH